MKTQRTLLFIILFAGIFLLGTGGAKAHFGSKGPFGGTVSCAITYNGFVYLGTSEGGVYESTTTQLVSWRARPVGLKSGKITALAHSGSYLFAGTADSGIFIFNGFVGSDRYWNKINTGLGDLRIRSLQALDSITLLAGTDNGLYKTTNKGGSWTAVNHGSLNNMVITAMAYSGSRIFLSTEIGGVYVSDDGGANWTDFNDANTLSVGGTISVSYSAASDELAVVNGNGLYIAGSAVNTGTPSYVKATGLPLGIALRSITNNLTHWYLTSDLGVYSAAVGVPGWGPVNTGLPLLDVTAAVALPDTLVAGVREEGVFITPAASIQWVKNNSNFNNVVTRSMFTAGDSLVVAVTNKGVFVSKDLATTYVSSNNGLTDSTEVNDIILANYLFFAATTNGGVFVSGDSGKTWSASNNGLNSMNIVRLFYANAKKYAVDAAGTLYEAPFSGPNWSVKQQGLPSGISPSSMCFYGNHIYLGTRGHGVFWKDHSDSVWTAFNTGLSNMNVTSLAASGRRVYAGTDGAGVFISETESADWSVTTTPAIAHSLMLGIGSNHIQAMASHAGFVYASYKGGLVTTADSAATWIQGGNQFNLPSYTDVNKITLVRSRVFVTSENNGLYSNALAELPVFPDTFLIVSQDSFYLPALGERNQVTVNSNAGWEVTTLAPWLTLSYPQNSPDGTITIDAATNLSLPRVGYVVVRAGSRVRSILVMQDGPGGMAEMEASILVYPNPNAGVFQIDFTNFTEEAEGISVFNATGVKVLEREVNGENTMQIEGLRSSGIYFVQIQTKHGNLVKKVVVH